MELVNVNLYAEGYCATYEDNIWIKKSSYEKLKNDFIEEAYCGELDGKHSEVYGGVEVQDKWKTDDDFAKEGRNKCDGDYLSNALKDLYDNNNLDYETEQAEIEKYFDGLDVWVDVTISIPHSKIINLLAYAGELKYKM